MNHLNTNQLNTGQPGSGRPVTLQEMLDAREQRFYRQQWLLSDYHCTLISFTMNIPGPVKNSYLIQCLIT